MRRDKGRFGYKTNKTIKYCSSCAHHKVDIKLAPFEETKCDFETDKCIERKRKTRKVIEEIENRDTMCDEIEQQNIASKKQYLQDKQQLYPLFKYSVASKESNIDQAQKILRKTMKNCIGNPMHKHHFFIYRDHRSSHKEDYYGSGHKYFSKNGEAYMEEPECDSDSD